MHNVIFLLTVNSKVKQQKHLVGNVGSNWKLLCFRFIYGIQSKDTPKSEAYLLIDRTLCNQMEL